MSGAWDLAFIRQLVFAFVLVATSTLALVGGKIWFQHYGMRPYRRFRRGERVVPQDVTGAPEIRDVRR